MQSAEKWRSYGALRPKKGAAILVEDPPISRWKKVEMGHNSEAASMIASTEEVLAKSLKTKIKADSLSPTCENHLIAVDHNLYGTYLFQSKL